MKSLLETNSNLAISCLDNDIVSKNFETHTHAESIGEQNIASAASVIGDLYNQIYQQKNRQLNANPYDGASQQCDSNMFRQTCQKDQQKIQAIDQNQLSLISNNLLFKMNANRQTIASSPNSEILHRNFGQMSGKYFTTFIH